MSLILFRIYKYSLYCELGITFLSITFGEKQRALFSYEKSGYDSLIDIFFIRIKDSRR